MDPGAKLEKGPAGTSGEGHDCLPKEPERQLSLEEVLRNSCRVSAPIDEQGELNGMSVFPSIGIPLAPSRGEYSDVKYSTQYNRTLRIGKDVLEPVEVFGDEKCRSTWDVLRNNQIEQLNSLQRSAWPHILRGRDCAIIGGAHNKKGKSLAYLVPLTYATTKMIQTFRREEQEQLTGPVGLILCGSSKSCHKVYEMLTKLLQGTRITSHIVQSNYDKESKKKLERNTDFVVTTPPAALGLFEDHFDKFQFERLRYLVLDDTQHTFQWYMPEIQDLIRKVHNFRARMETQRPLQTILCGSEWNESIASATLKVCNDAVLLLESSMAALQYGAIDIRVHYFSEPSEKLREVCKICEEFSPTSHSIIVCNDPATILALSTKLYRDSKITVHSLDEKEENFPEKIRHLQCRWKNSGTKQMIFIVTDFILKELLLTDAQNVVHFDVPQKKKESFADRHMCMWAHFPAISDFHLAGDEALKSRVPLKSHVLLTSMDEDLHKIVLKLHGIKVSIPPDLLAYAKKENEKRLLKQEICPNFKAFGKCISTDPCTKRHAFSLTEVTQESLLPKKGRIQVELLESKDVNHYTAKLLSYYDVVQEKKVDFIRFANLDKKLREAMDAFYSSRNNRIPVENPLVGSYCATQAPDLLYRRCQVQSKMDGTVDDPLWRIFLIDVGEFLIRAESCLFVLPEELGVTSKKQLTVNLYLAGLKPCGKEPTFSTEAKREARKMTKNSIFTGKISLSQGNDVWVNSLVEHKRGLHEEWIQVRSLRVDYIKRFHFGDDNSEHMELLYQSCELVSGISYDRYRAVEILGRDLDTIFFQKGGEVRVEWAFLPNYSQEMKGSPTIPVWCTYYKSLDEIYVVRDDRTKYLDQLTQEMDDDISSMICDKYTKYASIFEEYYEVGLPVAAFESCDQKWNRGIIIDKLTIEDELVFDIFFVDHGDIGRGMKMKDMFPLRSAFVSKLPFQVIQIKCSQIAPLDADFEKQETWSLGFGPEVNNFLESYFISNNESMLLEITATRKHGFLESFEPPLCRVYDALIMEGGSGKNIPEIVVENKMGKYVPGGEEEIKLWKGILLQNYNKLVDEATKFDEEEDTDDGNPFFDGDDDDFDAYLGFDQKEDAGDKIEMAKKVLADFGIGELIGNAPVGSSQKAILETPPPAVGASAKISGCKKEMKAEAPEPIFQNTGPVLKKPKVEWKQTPEHLVLWIHIPDLVKYSLKIEEDLPHHRLSFQSQVPDGYGFQLDLLGKVLPPIQESPTGQYLILKIQKLSAKFRWPYLVVGKPKFHWLKRKLDEQMLATNKKEGYESDEKESGNSAGGIYRKNPNNSSYSPPVDDSDSDDEEIDFSDELLSDEDDESGARN